MVEDCLREEGWDVRVNKTFVEVVPVEEECSVATKFTHARTKSSPASAGVYVEETVEGLVSLSEHISSSKKHAPLSLISSGAALWAGRVGRP